MNQKTIDLISKNIEQIIGEPVYLVGGSVRDILLGREPKDLDYCTAQNPDTIEDNIRNAGLKAYTTGKRFGTIGCKIEGKLIEVTTFRGEIYRYNDRKPDVIWGKYLEEDLGRRDFTINAMAYREGKIVDPFGGQFDLRIKQIRAVGNPKLRFKEDPLRMLRAIRFATVLNFDIEPYTVKKLTELNYKILSISKERWMQEMDKIIISPNVRIGLNYLRYTSLLNWMFPLMALQVNYDQNNKYHTKTLWEHTLSVVEATPQDINLRWAAFLHDIAKPCVKSEKNGQFHYYGHEYLGKEIVENLGRYLKWSNERIEIVTEIIYNHLKEDSILRPYDLQGH